MVDKLEVSLDEAVPYLVEAINRVVQGETHHWIWVVGRTRKEGAQYLKRVREAYNEEYGEYFHVTSDNNYLKTKARNGRILVCITYAAHNHRLSTADMIWLVGTSSWESGLMEEMRAEAGVVSSIPNGTVLITKDQND